MINTMYDRIVKILKNDQKYPSTKVGALIGGVAADAPNIETFFAEYPPLLDIIELGAALEYEGSGHINQIIEQIRYKLSELRKILPDIG